jgi:Zn-dependent protease
MALAWAALLKVVLLLPEGSAAHFLGLMSQAGILVNLVFMFLNLLPILPLDGGRIVASLLPQRAAWRYAKLEPWGLPLLILLLATNVLNFVLDPLVGASGALIRALVH